MQQIANVMMKASLRLDRMVSVNNAPTSIENLQHYTKIYTKLANAFSAASIVNAISASVCAAETKPASNADRAKINAAIKHAVEKLIKVFFIMIA